MPRWRKSNILIYGYFLNSRVVWVEDERTQNALLNKLKQLEWKTKCLNGLEPTIKGSFEDPKNEIWLKTEALQRDRARTQVEQSSKREEIKIKEIDVWEDSLVVAMEKSYKHWQKYVIKS